MSDQDVRPDVRSRCQTNYKTSPKQHRPARQSTSTPALYPASDASWHCSLHCWFWAPGGSSAGVLPSASPVGCAIAYVNFHWLKRVIAGFVDRATGAATSQSGQGIVFRFLLRYFLMALGAYVILTVSPASLNGLLAGLFLPVAAIGCEAAYELYAALARGV